MLKTVVKIGLAILVIINSHRDAFRTSLLTKAGLLDELTSSIDINSVQSVNEVINSVNAI